MEIEMILLSHTPDRPYLALPYDVVENMTVEDALNWCRSLRYFQEKIKDSQNG